MPSSSSVGMTPTAVWRPVTSPSLNWHQPEQGRTGFSAGSQPQEVTVLGIALEPVDVREDRLGVWRHRRCRASAGRKALGARHEGPHGHRVVAQLALDAFGGTGRLRAEGEPVMTPSARSVIRADQRLTVAGAPADR